MVDPTESESCVTLAEHESAERDSASVLVKFDGDMSTGGTNREALAAEPGPDGTGLSESVSASVSVIFCAPVTYLAYDALTADDDAFVFARYIVFPERSSPLSATVLTSLPISYTGDDDVYDQDADVPADVVEVPEVVAGVVAVVVVVLPPVDDDEDDDVLPRFVHPANIQSSVKNSAS